MGEVIETEELNRLIEESRSDGLKIVFTNGVFDILHAGHLDYLNRSKKLGDILIVGVNTDESAKAIKGPDRPFNGEEDRAALLAGLECVDYVTLFSETTPIKLISLLKPDLLVKGADYSADEVVGKELVESFGGEVKLISFKEGFSTSRLIDKIKSGD
ncbi:MAG: D-glycero-beta-D-manno-heptose 1-phosphate adenylyltransferase [Candidatus Marinimicrobia bacterium]|nr:D-glycero-beta-D-manno-heptose 1-phosphate adenylyltransferase [Candidatus Neomarinimicrobiota bacterium]